MRAYVVLIYEDRSENTWNVVHVVCLDRCAQVLAQLASL